MKSVVNRLSYILIFALSQSMLAQARERGWPMRGSDAPNSGVSAHRGPIKVRVAWRSDRKLRLGVRRAAVAPDGTIYAAVTSGQDWWLIALLPDGSEIWRAPLVDSQGHAVGAAATPIVGPNGNIYVGWAVFKEDTEVKGLSFHAFDREGNQLWMFEPNIVRARAGKQEPILGSDGTIYIGLDTAFTRDGDEHGSLLALDSETGKLKWRWITPHRESFWGGAGAGVGRQEALLRFKDVQPGRRSSLLR